MKLTGPRLERAMLRQARRVPNDKGSSWSTVGELKPSDSNGGNSSRSIPCRKTKKKHIVLLLLSLLLLFLLLLSLSLSGSGSDHDCHHHYYFFKLPYLTKLNERQIQDAKFSRPQREFVWIFFFNLRASIKCIKRSQHFCRSLNAKVYAFCHTHATFENTELLDDLPGQTAFCKCLGWIAVTSLVSCTKSLTSWEEKKNLLVYLIWDHLKVPLSYYIRNLI